jgi:hypothetical protein
MSALRFALLGRTILLVRLNTRSGLLLIVNVLNILITKCKRRK